MIKVVGRAKILLLGLLLSAVIVGGSGMAAELPAPIFQDGGYLVAKDGRIIAARNPERLLIPASTWKIATALLALERLGPEFRFPTHIYLREGNLLIKGFGDPLLVSEEVALIAARLVELGVEEIGDIILDDSFFRLDRERPAGAGRSLRSYDAANGALAVNFNTVNIEVDSERRVSSAEEQTPTLPVMTTVATGLSPGRHRINLSQQAERSLRYSGELFRELLRQRGVKVQGEIRSGQAPGQAPLTGEPLYRHWSSRPLSEVVESMLLYSNNFIANQLFLAVGAAEFGVPATWEKGQKSLTNFLAEVGLAASSFRVEEGSGLSRENRIAPNSLQRLLERFRPHAELLPRWRGRLVKSGTLSGVYAYAGYFTSAGQLDPFVLILNQPGNHRDRALDLLEKIYREN